MALQSAFSTLSSSPHRRNPGGTAEAPAGRTERGAEPPGDTPHRGGITWPAAVFTRLNKLLARAARKRSPDLLPHSDGGSITYASDDDRAAMISNGMIDSELRHRPYGCILQHRTMPFGRATT